MFISINLDPGVVDYLDSKCGGPVGRAAYIHNLLVFDKQNQQYAEPTYPEPEPDNTYNITTPRLHRRQSGFNAPQAPIKQRDRYGSM